MKYSCLIIDDEKAIAQAACEYLNIFDIPSFFVTSYDEGLAFLKENQTDLILLDINLGDQSGYELCKKIRETQNVPIIFISVRSSDDDVLTALNLGGDDYITKPFSLTILLAKVKAILRREELRKTAPAIPVETEGIVLDENYHQVYVDGTPVKLKEMEFKLLSMLMKNAGVVITKETIFSNVWEDSYVGEGTLSVHIRRLRQKIEIDADDPKHIKTVWGVGYVFEP